MLFRSTLNNYFVINENITEYARETNIKPDIITAKAFGPLTKTINFSELFHKKKTQLIVPISESQSNEFSSSLQKNELIHHPDQTSYYYFIKTF